MPGFGCPQLYRGLRRALGVVCSASPGKLGVPLGGFLLDYQFKEGEERPVGRQLALAGRNELVGELALAVLDLRDPGGRKAEQPGKVFDSQPGIEPQLSKLDAEAGRRRAGRVQPVRRPPSRKDSATTGEGARLHLFATCRGFRRWTINDRPSFLSLADR